MKTVDEGLAPIRAVRHAISQEVGHDPRRYVAYLQAVEERFARQIAAGRRIGQKPKVTLTGEAIAR